MYQKNSEKFSDLFKKRFLIEFTKELIKNSVTGIQFEEEQRDTKIPERSMQVKFQDRKIFRVPSSLRIPEPIMPSTFQYLHPYPTQKEIDLGKLNPLLRDNQVRVIECNGEDEPIVVEGTMGRKITKIFLSKEEIDEIIKRFSEEGKIPIRNGIHRIVVGRLIFSAIVSEIVSTKFLIRKMMFPVNQK
jgi:hypothetical protein